MGENVFYIDRKTGEKKSEKIYGKSALEWLYNGNFISRWTVTLIARCSLFSRLYGWWMRRSITTSKIAPFIEKFQIDRSEFLEPIAYFDSFNDFFCRKLKPEARPISDTPAIIPADGRYLVFPDISQSDGFFVKGQKFSLEALLKDAKLAQTYREGSMVISRLNPTDYHRFHFPVDCQIPSEPHLINGCLYSVHPFSLRKNIHRMTENKRFITILQTGDFDQVLDIEVGATNVGSIHQTYGVGKAHMKGEEKGYFSFGGSTLILLFKPNQIQFSDDLTTNSAQHHETLSCMGQPLGTST